MKKMGTPLESNYLCILSDLQKRKFKHDTVTFEKFSLGSNTTLPVLSPPKESYDMTLLKVKSDIARSYLTLKS